MLSHVLSCSTISPWEGVGYDFLVTVCLLMWGILAKKQCHWCCLMLHVYIVFQVLRNNYLMIGIDGSLMLESGSDWFCYHSTSPCIFPVGFCEINNIDLTPPKGRWLFCFHSDDFLKVLCFICISLTVGTQKPLAQMACHQRLPWLGLLLIN